MFGRGFTGNRMDGVKRYQASTIFKESVKSGVKPTQLTTSQRYQKEIENRIKSVKEKLAKELKYKFVPPGAERTEKKPSPAAEKFLKKMADIQKRREERKKKQKITVAPRSFAGAQGGRLDANGKILDKRGRVVGHINLKNGKIVNAKGVAVGKYKPNSSLTDHTIVKLIQDSKRLRTGGPWGIPAQNGPMWGSANWGSSGWGSTVNNGGGSIFGPAPQTNSLWGSSGWGSTMGGDTALWGAMDTGGGSIYGSGGGFYGNGGGSIYNSNRRNGRR